MGWNNQGSHLEELWLQLALWDMIIPLVKGSLGILTRGLLNGEQCL